jgi:hypothetical protein
MDREMQHASNDSPPYHRTKVRFSLKAMLIVMTLLAMTLGAYFIGYYRGFKTAQAQSEADYVIWNSPTNWSASPGDETAQ